MKTAKILLAAFLLVGCTKEIEIENTAKVQGVIPPVIQSSLTLKIYMDNGRNQYLIDSAKLYVGFDLIKDTIKSSTNTYYNSLAFTYNGAQNSVVSLLNFPDSLPFSIINPALPYYTLKVFKQNTPENLYLYDGAGVVLSSTDITATYIPLEKDTTKYSFLSQKNFGVDLEKRFAIVKKGLAL